MNRFPIQFYRDALSGHCHRVELLLRMLELAFEPVEMEISQGDAMRSAFLELNRFAEVPVIVDGGTVVPDSIAILVYLARRYGGGRWLPADPRGEARVQRWLSAAAGPIEFGVWRARDIALFGAKHSPKDALSIAHRFLGHFEEEVGSDPFLAGTLPTIADLACYTPLAHAGEGGVSLDLYPQVRAWLARVEGLPGFVPMRASRPRYPARVR